MNDLNDVEMSHGIPVPQQIAPLPARAPVYVVVSSLDYGYSAPLVVAMSEEEAVVIAQAMGMDHGSEGVVFEVQQWPGMLAGGPRRVWPAEVKP